jgi:eukaryotic-like serine/threonine-protein kinase
LAQLMPQASELGSAALTVTSVAPLSAAQPLELSGTIPYMAPEQLKGEKPDPRNDIWSAGAVLYEMATGRRAFAQTNSSILINAILNDAPAPPSSVNNAIPAELDRIILRALAKDPAQRYQKAQDFMEDLKRQSATPAPPHATHLMRWLGLGIGAGLAVAIGAYLVIHANKPVITVAPPPPHRRAVAVLDFKNLAGNPQKAWISTALSEMLTTELGEGDQLRTIPGESVAQMKISLKLPEAESFSQKTLHRIGRNLGSDDVVVGSFLPLGDGQLRLDLRLQDTTSGETIATVSEKGNESQIDDLVSKAGDELRGKLGIAPLSEAQSASARASLPSNPEAARLYFQGLQALRLFDARSARNLFERAMAIEPDYALTHAALAGALSALGYDDKAKEQAQKALDLSTQVSREERLLIEGRSHKLLGQWQGAIDNYHALFEFFPDEVDYGVSLASAQVSAGQLSDAEATLGQLRKLKVSEADAARIDLWDAEIGLVQGDMKRQQALSDKAVSEGKAIGASLFVAEALIVKSDALEKMGQPEKATSLIEQARALYAATGDERGIGRTLLFEGDSKFDQGDYRQARKDFEEALTVFGRIGAQGNIRNSYERIGNVLYKQGKPQESTDYYNKALQFDLSIHDLADLASDYGNIANAMDDLGNLEEALKMQHQALDAFAKVNDKKGEAETLSNLGNLAMEMGSLGDAKKYFNDSLAMAREIGYRRSEPYPMEGLGDVLEAQGNSPGATKEYEQALALSKEMKNVGLETHIRLTQGFILLDEGKFSEGEKQARQVLADLDKTDLGAISEAQSALGRSLLGEGNVKDAREAVSQAVSLAQKSLAKSAYFEAALADGRVKAKSGKYAEGHQELETALATAHKFGYRLYEYEFQLALAETELDANAPGARPRLAALETEARSWGVLQVANRAKALAQTK